MSDASTERRERLVTFDSSVFSLAAVKKAAYQHIQSFSVDISLQASEIRCTLRFVPDVNDATCEQLVDEYKKEVLDQDLRERLKVETEAVRNLILAHAFSKAGLANEQVSED